MWKRFATKSGWTVGVVAVATMLAVMIAWQREIPGSHFSVELWNFGLAGLRTAVMALLVSTIYLAALTIVVGSYRALAEISRGRSLAQFFLEFTVYTLFVLSALFPISLVMEADLFRSLSSESRVALSLLLINGLLFYLGISFLEFAITESNKSYAVSAEFKSQRRVDATTEASWHFVVSRWPSVFYFVLTFTIVPELMEPGTNFFFRDTLGDSLVLDIFRSALAEGLSASIVWLQALILIGSALLVRLVCIDACLFALESRLGIERSGS